MIVIVGYVLLYTPLKTRTSASTAIGAIPGAMPPLMGWTAAANEITLGAWALFAMLFLWQFPHFLAIAWMYREEYAKAGILMLPVVEPSGRLTARQIVLFTIMLLPVSLAPFFLGFAGSRISWSGRRSLAFGSWSRASGRHGRKRSSRARRLLLVSVIYLPLDLRSCWLSTIVNAMEIGTAETIRRTENRRETRRHALPASAPAARATAAAAVTTADGGGDGAGLPIRGRCRSRCRPTNHEFITWFLLLVVLMTFGGLIGAYIVIATNNAAEWQPFDLPVQVWISTAIILVSSVTYHFAKTRDRPRRSRNGRNWLIATTVLGAAFISSQILAWLELVEPRALYARKSVRGFFLHPDRGSCGPRSRRDHRTWGDPAQSPGTRRRAMPRCVQARDLARSVGWYWHFMGGLWIVLFLLLGFWK